MQKQVFLYGLGLAALIVLLKYVEYSFFIKSFSQEVYIGIIAVFFTAFGVWTGVKWIQRKQIKEVPESFNPEDIEKVRVQLEISKREMDVLQGMAKGLSNRQIAEQLFLSESTIKTHSSNLFAKLDVSRRTQAVQKSRELGLLQ